MPGPKMGPRPADFDEEVIRQSPTFLRWMQLETSQKLRYACREFVKDHGDDEERLMRRIMIARRNNIRDHETLKRARRQTKTPTSNSTSTGAAAAAAAAAATKAAANIASAAAAAAAAAEESNRRSRRPPSSFSDSQVEKEMDAPAVAATRSYRSWLGLPDGAEFVYNQKYIKGRDGHDWLLRKNIWRRMRYRRENKKMVERLKDAGELVMPQAHQQTKQEPGGEMSLVPGAPGGDQSASGDADITKTEPMDIADMDMVDTKDGILTASNTSNTNNNDQNDTTIDDDDNNNNNNNNNDVDAATHAAAAAAATGDHLADLDAVEAAVAAAETFGKSEGMDMSHVHNPLEAAVAQAAALDAAAQLAAASHQSLDEEGLPREDIPHEESV
jgi:hypothetical protein